MKTNINSAGMELTEALKSYVKKVLESVEKVLPKNSDPVVELEVGKTSNHHKSGNIFKAEINIKFDGKVLTAEEKESDLYAAIDAMKDTIIREIKKMKDKKKTLIKKANVKNK